MHIKPSSPIVLSGNPPIVGAQTVHRVASIMRLLSLHHREGLRLIDVARLAGLERPSAHRLLQAMVALSLASQVERRYFLGSMIFEMSVIASPEFDIRQICAVSASDLAERVEDTVYVTVQNGLDAVCIERCIGRYPIRVFTLDIGERRPMGVGAGSVAMLAEMSPEEADAVITANVPRYAQYEGVNEHNVRRYVEETREKGYLTRLGRINPEVKTIAAVVTLAAGRPIAGLSVAAIESRIPEEREQDLVEEIRQQAEKMRQTLRAHAGI